MMPNIYELYGRAVEQLAQANEKAEAAVQILIAVKKGERSLDDIEVTPQGISVKNSFVPNGQSTTPIPAEVVEETR